MDRELSGVFFRMGNKNIEWSDMTLEQMAKVASMTHTLDWWSNFYDRLIDVLKRVGNDCNVKDETDSVLATVDGACQITPVADEIFYIQWCYFMGVKLHEIGEKYNIRIAGD